MRALYRSGEQADALEAYRQTRSLFDRELGMKPAPMREAERSILTHDSDLAAPAQNRKRRWLLLAVPTIVVAAVAGSFAWSIRDQRDRYDLRPRVTRTVRLDRTPAGIAANPKDVWVSVD